jgi:hypothetical protein
MIVTLTKLHIHVSNGFVWFVSQRRLIILSHIIFIRNPLQRIIAF